LSVLFPANAQRSTGARRVASNAKRLAPTQTLKHYCAVPHPDRTMQCPGVVQDGIEVECCTNGAVAFLTLGKLASLRAAFVGRLSKRAKLAAIAVAFALK
jgi:hypothetical protein